MSRSRTALCLLLILLTGSFAVTRAQSGQESTGARPDYSWILSSDQYDLLSGAGETMIRILSGEFEPTAAVPGQWSREDLTPAPGNVLVNNPGADLGASTTQSETSHAVSPLTGTIVASWNDSGSYPVSGDFDGWGRSTDGGKTWTDNGTFPPIAGGHHFGDPSMVVHNATGAFYCATLAETSTGRSFIGVSKSTTDGASWLPQVDGSPGTSALNFQDKEILAIDNTGGPRDGYLYLAWREFGATGRILFSRSTNGAASFSTPISLATGDRSGTYPVVTPNGDIYVFWEDRATGRLEYIRSTDGGVTWGPINLILTLTRTGEPGPTATCGRPALNGNIRTQNFPRAAVNYAPGPNFGHLYVVYNSKPSAGDESDVFFIRSTNGGATWSAPLRVNNDAGTNGNFFPEVAVNAEGVICVSWYDRRQDPLNRSMQYMCAFSTNGGTSFGSNEFITNLASPGFPPAVNFDPIVATCYMGEYNWVVADGADFLVSWGDNRLIQNGHNDPDIRFGRKRVRDPQLVARGTCLATRGFGPGVGDELLRINPATGAATVIGRTFVDGLPGLAINSVGEVYASGGYDVGDAFLYRIDAATGAAFMVGPTGMSWMQAMAFDENDVLYAIGTNGPDQLFTINTTTGVATLVAAMSTDIAGMAFDPTNGQLYGTAFGGGADALYRINKATGVATLVGNLGLGQGIGDIHFDGAGNLYGTVGGGGSTNNFVAIDKTTGAATVIGPVGYAGVTGLAFHPPITNGVAGVVYGSTGNLDGGRLIRINPATGAGALIGTLPGIGNMPGIAIRADGAIFGASGSNFYRVSADGSGAQLIGSPGFLNGMAFSPAGVLYASDALNLYTVNTSTGVRTLIGAHGTNAGAGLAFDPTNGQLYGITADGNLHRISTTTGAATLVGYTGFPATPDIFFDGMGNLYGSRGGGTSGNNDLIAINKTTGAGAVVGSIGFTSVSGLAYLAVPPQLAQRGVCYGTQGYNGTGELVRIDPVTGAGTIIGNTGVAGMPGLAINSRGEMYGAGGPNSGVQNLYRIDAATGTALFIGNTGISCFQAMAFDEDDVLYATGTCGPDQLYTVNTATGALTPVGAVVPDMVGLAFDPTDGRLYGVEWNNFSSIDNLWLIDKITGATTLIGSLGVGVGVGDIHFDGAGNLYGVVGGGAGPNDLVAIDKTTGAATIIGPVGIPAITGLAFHPPIANALAGAIYGSTGNLDDGRLIRIDLNTGAGTLLGTLPGIGNMPGIAIRADGAMFGSSGGNFYRVSADGSGAELIGSPGFLNGMAFNASNVLYASDALNLYTVNTTTGARTLIGAHGTNAGAGLAFDPTSGQLYGITAGGDLHTISTATGLATYVGSTGLATPDIFFNDYGQLYASSGGGGQPSNDLVAIDKATGTTTLVGPIGFTSVSGLSKRGDGPIAAAQSGVCYGTQGYNGTGEFVRINPATGAGTIIGNTGVAGMPGLAINSSGQIYGAGGPSASVQFLHRIDATTGAATPIGNTGIACFQAMAFDETDVLYATGICGPDQLFIVDTATGALTAVAPVAPDMVGLAFDPTDGQLYGVEWFGASSLDRLWRIDKATGATTLVGSLGLGIGVGDIHFDGLGNLYGVVGGGAGPNDFVSINKATGAATVIGPVGIPAITGLSVLPQCPADIAVNPPSLEFFVPANGITAGQFAIRNVAASNCGTLNWTLSEEIISPRLPEGVVMPARSRPVEGYAAYGRRVELVLDGEDGQSVREADPLAGYFVQTSDDGVVQPSSGAESGAGRPVASMVGSGAAGSYAAGGEDAPTVDMILDDGSYENAITCGGACPQFLWLNRFTPAAGDFPFRLSEVQVLFPPASGVSIGQLVDIYVWEDTDGDGDPATNANLLGTKKNAAVQAVDGALFSKFAMPPIILSGPNDVLIGIVNRTAGLYPGEPAAQDTNTDAMRSWLGAYVANPVPDPPPLPADAAWGTATSFGLPGNLMVRGFGVPAVDCPWLSEAPMNGSTPSGGGGSVVDVFIDAAGLIPGDYVCNILVHSNDPDRPVVILPVTLHVTPYIAPAQIDVCYGSTGVQDGGRIITINPATGAGTLVGDTGLPRVQGLAINSVGEMYGTQGSPSQLYRIDAASGASVRIGSTGAPWIEGIAFDQSDVLYGVSETANTLYTINPITAVATPVGPLPACCFVGLAFDPTTGNLYASQGAGTDGIWRLNPATGNGVLVGPTGLGGSTPDLHFDAAGNLYGAKGGGGGPNNFIRINKATGAGVVIGSIGFTSVSGLATIPGVWAVSAPEGMPTPVSYALMAARPNPVNPTTRIEFGLPETARVRLEVFNPQGQRVAVLVDGTLAAGLHSVPFDGTGLANGVYFYRMHAGEFNAVRKMTLVR